ncbi:hypothetical protein BU17DRAFT_86669 [Hysterangium stoloniferum]|nr:hypothetical protein BU17DRAFT_86669 [Hysterangium stoloniferum]
MSENWLFELHKKLWKQESLRASIFRSAKVTRTHYSELQARLDVAHPSRNSKTYEAADVLSIKLDVLNTFVPVQSSTSDDDYFNAEDKLNPDVDMKDDSVSDAHVVVEDDSSGDDFNHDDLFELLPTRIRYIDITPLNLISLPPVHFPLLIRDEYEALSSILDKRKKGKTSYLFLLLMHRILRGERTIFQNASGAVYEISNIVQELSRSNVLNHNDVVALVDADQNHPAPTFEVQQSGARIVVTSSPKDKKVRSWMKHLPGGNVAIAYMMDPFTFREYLLAGIFLHPQDLTYARLHAARTCLGINPRRCFLASTSPACLKNEVASVNDVIGVVPRSTSIISLIDDTRGSGEFSHYLFEVHSLDDDHFFSGCLIKPVSEWVFGRLLEKYEERQASAARELYDLIRREPALAPTSGIIWERQCHRFFRSLRFSRSFNLRSLDDPSQTIIWDYPGGTEHKAFESASFSTELEAQIRRKTSTYFQPLSACYPTLDSLLYRPDRLDFLQMTVAQNHPSKIAGFQRIQRGLKLKGPASNLRPSKEQPWMFIFIVPEETAPSFTKQPFGEVCDSKVKQYVLALSQKDIWEY